MVIRPNSRRPSLLVGLTGLIMVVADDSMFSLWMVIRGRSSMDFSGVNEFGIKVLTPKEFLQEIGEIS